MICYSMREDGLCRSVRFVTKDYQPQADEHLLEGDTLPDIETLHTPEFKQARDAERASRESQAAKRQAAIDALLAEQAKRADAPQAVKDYAAIR